MKRKIELLAPGGDVDSIKAAILAGADAIYCGLNHFNARNRATNIDFDDLNGILNLAHRNSCKVFLTLNIIIVESEIRELFSVLNRLINTSIDGVIVQDWGLFHLLSKHFKGLQIHASTQLNTHNEGQIHFLKKLNVSRVNLSRELNLDEIKNLTAIAHQHNISTEIFIHGSYCICFSGLCYMSSVLSGKSGNRGRCSQPCRDQYGTTPEGKNYPLNLKDNSAYFDLKGIYEAGVASIKIEGRIKKSDYIYMVVQCWRKQIQSFFDHNRLLNDNNNLFKVFNRDFSNGFLKGNINKNMFIDNPRDNSIDHLSDVHIYSTESALEKDKVKLYEEKEKIKESVNRKIKQLNKDKVPLLIAVSGEPGTPLNISITTPDSSFNVLSKVNLVHVGSDTKKHQYLDYDVLFSRLKALNATEYYIKDLELANLENNLFLSFKELTSIKKRVLYILNGSKEFVDPIDVPILKKQNTAPIQPTLSVLISSQRDLNLCTNSAAEIFYQLPNALKAEYSTLTGLFHKNKRVTPWFPSVLIGEDYTAGVQFLELVQPQRIVTNNTGIAFEAYKRGITWIAGPYLNCVNSFSLLCLKENFDCFGSFISNEISKDQITRIVKPENFNLYYSMYHPIELLSSRQCLFHQITGCKKERIDETCIHECEKSSTITDMKKGSLFIKKTRGNYHCVYNSNNFLNTDIVTDVPDLFSSFFIDLRDVTTKTTTETNKSRIVELFENLLNGNPQSKAELTQRINPTTNAQYQRGI